MWRKATISTVCLVIGVGVPLLEVNATHLFNPQWPAHARLHEAWQLLSNCGLALLCLWLTWRARDEQLAGAVMFVITAGFLAAYLASGLYGGSMQHTDGTELAVEGVNVAVMLMLVATGALIAVLCLRRPPRP